MAIQWAALGAFISVTASSCALLIHAIQDSKCKVIKCGCISCIRDVSHQETPNTISGEE